MIKRLTVFICGPMTPRSPDKNHAIEYLAHINKMIWIARELIREGFAPYCPGLDFSYWLGGGYMPTAEDIYETDIALLLQKDAVLTLEGWTSSENCKREVNIAWKNGIPTYASVTGLKAWRARRTAEEVNE